MDRMIRKSSLNKLVLFSVENYKSSYALCKKAQLLLKVGEENRADWFISSMRGDETPYKPGRDNQIHRLKEKAVKCNRVSIL